MTALHVIRVVGKPILLIGLATLLRVPFESLLEYRTPFGHYFPVVVYCAWRRGFWYGMYAGGLATLSAMYFYLEPIHQILAVRSPDRASIALFLLACVSISLIGESYQRSRNAELVAEERLREANVGLEAKVDERTHELVKKNEELESFSYAVSHDLRAPIRAIVARSQIVLEEEGSKLSEEGKDHLIRLSRAGVQLGALVDDLLQFVRTGTRETEWARVDLANIVRSCYQECCAHFEGVDAELSVDEGLHCTCDPLLMQSVLQNLVENAFKYKKNGEKLYLEFGLVPDSQPPVYYLKDNGIGIDMAYADKLFKPFERLHRDSNITGTGIGLANVRRAMERQGGASWIDSEIGVGTTVYLAMKPVARSLQVAGKEG